MTTSLRFLAKLRHYPFPTAEFDERRQFETAPAFFFGGIGLTGSVLNLLGMHWLI